MDTDIKETHSNFEQTIELRGHIVDSMMLPQLMDGIMDLGGKYQVEEFELGRTITEPSFCRMRLMAATPELLDETLKVAQRLGATILADEDAAFEPAPRDPFRFL